MQIVSLLFGLVAFNAVSAAPAPDQASKFISRNVPSSPEVSGIATNERFTSSKRDIEKRQRKPEQETPMCGGYEGNDTFYAGIDDAVKSYQMVLDAVKQNPEARPIDTDPGKWVSVVWRGKAQIMVRRAFGETVLWSDVACSVKDTLDHCARWTIEGTQEIAGCQYACDEYGLNYGYRVCLVAYFGSPET